MRPTSAQKWFNDGVESATNCAENLGRSKTDGLKAGWFFIRAKLAAGHGEFGLLCAANSGSLAERTIQRFMQFTRLSMWRFIEENREEADSLTGGLAISRGRNLDDEPVIDDEALLKCEDLFQAVIDGSLMSPKDLVAVCREVGLMRRIEEYPSTSAAAAKRRRENRAGRQLLFDFGMATAGLETLMVIDRDPARIPKPEKLDALITQTEAALEHLRAVRKTLTVEAA